MKKFLTSIILCFLILGGIIIPSGNVSANQEVKTSALGFSDVSDNYTFKDDIHYLTSKGIISGYSDGTFRPNDNVNRQQALIMIGRALGWDGTPRNTVHPDVPINKTGSGYIQSAYERGITQYLLFSKNNLAFHYPLSRGDMAVLISRSFDLPLSFNNPYTDLDPSSTGYQYILNVTETGIAKGYSNGQYDSFGYITRGQFSAFLRRALETSYRSENNIYTGNGNLKGTITWQYNNYIGTKPDVGAKVFLIPTYFNYLSYHVDERKLFAITGSAPKGFIDSNCHFAEVNGYGQYELSNIPSGKYYIIISSRNTRSELTVPSFSKNLLEPLLGPGEAYNTFELLNLKLKKHEIKEIEILNGQTVDVSKDFGYTYF